MIKSTRAQIASEGFRLGMRRGTNQDDRGRLCRKGNHGEGLKIKKLNEVGRKPASWKAASEAAHKLDKGKRVQGLF